MIARDTMKTPILSADELRTLSRRILEMTTAETTVVRVHHIASGIARVMRGEVHLSDSGDTLSIGLTSRFGQRVAMHLDINQIDPASLRHAVQYLERVASQQPGDPVETRMPIPPRTYLPNTTWHDTTAAAFDDARHAAIEMVTAPVVRAGLVTSACVGVTLVSRSYADKQGMLAAGQSSDSEVTVTAWNPNGKGSGWAGQATREWETLDVTKVADEAIRLTKLAANPVIAEPGRRTAILDRPAVAQLVARMGWAFNADRVLNGGGPLYDHVKEKPRLGERVFDPRITLSSDPNDREGGYLPFNMDGYPLVPMTWVGTGAIFQHLAYNTYSAAIHGISPANDDPRSLRMSGGTSSVEEMIANCKEGIYVNRFSQVSDVDYTSGMMTGLTNGACFYIKDGKITKSLRQFRFLASPWHFLNRVEMIGPSERTAFGYAPWQEGWPVSPTIVPPLMVRDFNFVGLADNV